MRIIGKIVANKVNQDWVFQPLWERFGPSDRVSSCCGPLETDGWNWEKLLEDYASMILRSRFIPDSPHDVLGFKKQEVLIALSEDSFLAIRHGVPEVFSPSLEKAREWVKDIEENYFARDENRFSPGFHLIHYQEDFAGKYDLNLDYLKITKAYLREAEELPYYYGDEMADFDHQLKENMRTFPTGIAFFHGNPGTGKTSYIRHLIDVMSESHDFYMISLSEFWGFLHGKWYLFWRERMKSSAQRRAVLIVEDAEMHIERNASGGIWERSPVMTEFLQVADGLMGDSLNMQIIITTNLKLKQIDSALTRKGRLLGYRDFRSLTHLEAHRLYTRLGKDLTTKQEEWTLAELMDSPATPQAPRKKKSYIGFMQQDMEI